MRKSTYMTPDIKVRQIETTALMAASGEEQNISIDVVDSNNTYEGTFHSKQHTTGLWDEEEE